MLVPAPEVSPLFLAAIEELKRRGVEPTPAEIAWIYDASKHVTGKTRECPRWVDPDVWVGGVALHGLSIGASLWWEQYGEEVFAGAADADRIGAWAWLLHHAGDREYLSKHVSPARIRAAVLAFVVGLPWAVTIADLAWAVAAALGRGLVHVGSAARVKKGASALEWGETVAWLSHEYKRPPEDFLWGMDMDEVNELTRAASNSSKTRAAAESAEKLAEWRAVIDAVAAAHQGKGEEHGV